MMKSLLPNNGFHDANGVALAVLMVALFTFSEFLTSAQLTKASDLLGRKPILMIGVVGGSISALLFGFSTSLWMALTARTFGGLFNPNVGVVSVCVGELVKKKEQQGIFQVVHDILENYFLIC